MFLSFIPFTILHIFNGYIKRCRGFSKSRLNSAIVFRLWRYDDHAECRKQVGLSSRPLHSLACFMRRDNSAFEAKKIAGIFGVSWLFENLIAEGFAICSNFKIMFVMTWKYVREYVLFLLQVKSR